MSKVVVHSQQQMNVFDHVNNKQGSANIVAVAGAGKSYTIKKAIDFIPPTADVKMMAFNKSIADALSVGLPKYARAKTFHAEGNGAWMKYAGGNVKVNANKVRDIIRETITDELAQDAYASPVAKLVSIAKQSGMGSLIKDDDNVWLDLADYFSIEPDTEDGSTMRMIELSRKILAKSVHLSKQVIDYDDMLYMPIRMNLRFWTSDWVFIDEAQDTNPVRRAMAKRMVKPGGALVAVGDPCQAIYGFTGANSNSMDLIKTDFNSKELGLTVSYRCPKAILPLVRPLVPYFDVHKGNVEGSVEDWGKKDVFEPTDAVICRNTAPLVGLAYSLLGSGVPCKILGRDIGAGLIALIDKMRGRGIDSLMVKLEEHRDVKVAELMAKDKETQAQAIEDKVQAVLTICERLGPHERTIPQLKQLIQSMFGEANEGRPVLTLMTIHKAKGLEFKRVIILEPQLMPSKFARKAWQQQQELNAQYVAYTRAIEQLKFLPDAAAAIAKAA